jgi:hypothetical protein
MSDVLIKSMEWNMLSRGWNLSVSDLSELHQLSKGLLDALNELLPDRAGSEKVGTFKRLTASCTKCVKLSCGVGWKRRHARALSMHISI